MYETMTMTEVVMAVLCGVGMAAHGCMAFNAVTAMFRGDYKGAAVTVGLVGVCACLPVSATFWTCAGLVLAAVALVGAFCWLMSQAGRGDFFHWYGCWKLGECCLELLGVVLMALFQAVADSKG